MLSLKILQSLEFATTCLEEGMDETCRKEQIEWFKKMRNAVEYVVLELEEEERNVS
jgi:hypothetical protein